MAGSPAAQGGLKPCDLIEKVAGSAVKNPSEVQLAVDQSQIGQPLALTVRRQQGPVDLTVRPANLPRQE
jgi:S1-C subfamily serine protease